MEQTTPTIVQSENSRSEILDNDTKNDAIAEATPQPPSDVNPASSKSPSHPPPTSTEPSNMAAHTASRKKGTASTVKKTPKRPKNTGGPRAVKKAKAAQAASAGEAPESAGSELEESDHGPYCLCRGADDHRWMICCENCEDWFHGECINMNKEIGESLIEKFICPLCTNENLTTLYKKTCALSGCRKAARIAQEEQSVFCSNEHAQIWWERMVAKLPKAKGKGGINDQLTQEEFMALLESGLSGMDEKGAWRLVKGPFSGEDSKVPNGNEKQHDDSMHLSGEEKEFLEKAAAARFHLAEETVLCHKMLTLLEFAHERRQAAINAGRFKEDICGYDQRLDTISARDAFEAFAKSSEGEAIFKASKLDDPLGESDEVRGMCERKRCKIHSGWYKMLSLGLKHQIREMATQADEVGEEEKVMRQAAKERYRRKQSERNWVEVLDG
ncbi:Set1 complex component spp1 [Fusarium austroafricanum]|uniref:Set1 complex component spp1 n=1 Tax=Fusarium austroafricanum TaxID=2364996 RepID=A0A8H4K763_9HYPO|nr:Set1 complex component spp1 [Fusarium austroafricanum]